MNDAVTLVLPSDATRLLPSDDTRLLPSDATRLLTLLLLPSDVMRLLTLLLLPSDATRPLTLLLLTLRRLFHCRLGAICVSRRSARRKVITSVNGTMQSCTLRTRG